MSVVVLTKTGSYDTYANANVWSETTTGALYVSKKGASVSDNKGYGHYAPGEWSKVYDGDEMMENEKTIRSVDEKVNADVLNLIDDLYDDKPAPDYYLSIHELPTDGIVFRSVGVSDMLGHIKEASGPVASTAEVMAWVAFYQGKYGIPQTKVRYY